MGPLESQNSINITLLEESTLLNFLVLGDNVFTLYTLPFVCRFRVMHPCFTTCDSTLQESLSFFTVSLQKLHAHFHICPFVLICMLLLHPPHTNFVMQEVLVDNGISRSTIDVQLVGHISDSNLSVPLNQSLDLFKWSSLAVLVLP